MIDSETVYLFRHALLRDAAYQLQPPGERASLHALAITMIEAVAGSRPLNPSHAELRALQSWSPHRSDAYAAELVVHCRNAGNQQLLVLYLYRAAAYAESSHDNFQAARSWLELADRPDYQARGMALRRGAIAALSTQGPARVRALLGLALALFQAADDKPMQGVTLSNLGNVAGIMGSQVEAEEFFQQALALHRQAMDTRAEGETLCNLGTAWSNAGRDLEAAQAFTQAESMLRDAGHARGVATARINLGNLHRKQGRYRQARELYVLALDEACATGDLQTQTLALTNLGSAMARLKEPDLAMQMLTQALQLSQQVGDRNAQALACMGLGSLRESLGERSSAMQYFVLAQQLTQETGNLLQHGLALNNIASLLEDAGDFLQAQEHYQQAMSIHRKVGNRYLEGTTGGNLARLAARAGRHEEALAGYIQALDLLTQTGHVRYRAIHQCAYALLRLELGEASIAGKLWHEGATTLQALGESSDLQGCIDRMRTACTAAGVPPLDA